MSAVGEAAADRRGRLLRVVGEMGDAAKSQRREQLKRWAGSCTDREPAEPRRRRRGRDEEEQGEGEGDAVLEERDQDGNGPIRQKRPKRRFPYSQNFHYSHTDPA